MSSLEYASLVIERISRQLIRSPDGSFSADVNRVQQQRRTEAEQERISLESAQRDWQVAFETFLSGCTVLDTTVAESVSAAAVQDFCPRCATALDGEPFCPTCGQAVASASVLPTPEAFQAAQQEREWLAHRASGGDEGLASVRIRLESGAEVQCAPDRVRQMLEAEFSKRRPRPGVAAPATEVATDADPPVGYVLFTVASWSATLITDAETRELAMLPVTDKPVVDLPVPELTAVLNRVARDGWTVVSTAEDRVLTEDGAAATTRARYLLARQFGS